MNPTCKLCDGTTVNNRVLAKGTGEVFFLCAACYPSYKAMNRTLWRKAVRLGLEDFETITAVDAAGKAQGE